MLFSSRTTILKNVSCSYAPRVLVLSDLQSSAVTIIGTTPSKSIEVHVPFGPSAATVCISNWFFNLLYYAWCRL